MSLGGQTRSFRPGSSRWIGAGGQANPDGTSMRTLVRGEVFEDPATLELVTTDVSSLAFWLNPPSFSSGGPVDKISRPPASRRGICGNTCASTNSSWSFGRAAS